MSVRFGISPTTPSTFRSEVVDFWRSRLDRDTLSRGRIWAEMTGHDADFNLAPKSEGFRKWVDSLIGWIRRNYRSQSGNYVGRHAERWLETGAKLVSG